MGKQDRITFSSGLSWQGFLDSRMHEEAIQLAEADEEWIGREAVLGDRVIDIGTGSGIHRLAFHRMGAGGNYYRLLSYDVASEVVAALASSRVLLKKRKLTLRMYSIYLFARSEATRRGG